MLGQASICCLLSVFTLPTLMHLYIKHETFIICYFCHVERILCISTLVFSKHAHFVDMRKYNDSETTYLLKKFVAELLS